MSTEVENSILKMRWRSRGKRKRREGGRTIRRGSGRGKKSMRSESRRR